MIVFDKVTKKFPFGNLALDKVSFEIEENEFVFLVGPSGAGKTTILKLILADLLATDGSIMVNNLQIDNQFHKKENLRRNLGVVFQDFKILFNKNTYENIALGMKVLGVNQNVIKKEVLKALKIVGLSDKGGFFPSQLSAGELQRVSIARAVIGKRDIILADEPTGNLDPKTSWQIMKIFKKLEGKKTIIFATHNTDIVNSFRRRVLILKEGRLAKDVRKGGYQL